MLGIDDLGTEPSEVLDYGNVYTPVIDLLTKRYEEQLFTVITTNLTPQQIREHYGDRIADRLNEMVKKILHRHIASVECATSRQAYCDLLLANQTI